MSKVHRPKVLGGITVKVATGCGNMYVQLNWYHGQLFEIFATLGHSGGCSMSFSEALTRSISIGLRQEYPVPLEDYIEQMQMIRCPNPYMFPKSEQALSCPDAIAKVLKDYGNMPLNDIVKLIMYSDADITPISSEEEEAHKEIERLAKLREEQEL